MAVEDAPRLPAQELRDMADTDAPKPDFRNGLPFSDLPDRTPVAGRVEDDDVVVVRHGAELFAVGAYCTHYHGRLADGLIVGESVRCRGSLGQRLGMDIYSLPPISRI